MENAVRAEFFFAIPLPALKKHFYRFWIMPLFFMPPNFSRKNPPPDFRRI